MTMPSIRCLIIDDEMLARRLIRELLKKHSTIEIIAECDNGEDAVETIVQEQPDLIFLDMQMPVYNGLEVLAKSGFEKGVIFSTAYDQYAVSAFDRNAIDYLLKPYSQERFDQAIQKFITNREAKSESLANLLSEKKLFTERIQIKDRGQYLVVPVQDISHIEAEDDYVKIFYGNRSVLKTQTLSELERHLNPDQFIRIHRSTIINLSYLDRWEKTGKDTTEAILKTGAKLNISRSGLERLKEKLTT